MGDVASGITSFRRGLKEGVEVEADDAQNTSGAIIEGESSEANTDKK
jgi:hypothetical protein